MSGVLRRVPESADSALRPRDERVAAADFLLMPTEVRTRTKTDGLA